MEENEQKSSLISRTIKRVATKLHKSKVWKKIAGLTLVGAIAFSVSGCDNNSSIIVVAPGQQETEQPNNDKNQENDKTVDLSAYSFLIQNAYNNEAFNNIDELLATNLKNGLTADVYSNPYTFLQKRGYDVAAIKAGKLECHTDAFILDNQPTNLYMTTYVENKQKSSYEQYLLRYELTEQEAKEYHWLHKIRATQYFCLNDIISQNKTPKVLMTSKIDINSFKALLPVFRDNLLFGYGMESIMVIDRFDNNGGCYCSFVCNWVKPIPTSGPSEESWGKPAHFATYYHTNIKLLTHLKPQITDDGIIKIDTSAISQDEQNFLWSPDADEKDSKHIAAWQYCRQDLTLAAIPQVFKSLDAKLLKDGYLTLEEVPTANQEQQKTENK